VGGSSDAYEQCWGRRPGGRSRGSWLDAADSGWQQDVEMQEMWKVGRGQEAED